MIYGFVSCGQICNCRGVDRWGPPKILGWSIFWLPKNYPKGQKASEWFACRITTFFLQVWPPHWGGSTYPTQTLPHQCSSTLHLTLGALAPPLFSPRINLDWCHCAAVSLKSMLHKLSGVLLNAPMNVINLSTLLLCIHRLITQQLARLQSTDMRVAAAEFGDNVRIDSRPSLFRSLYGWMELSAFNSADPQQQARWFYDCWFVTMP